MKSFLSTSVLGNKIKSLEHVLVDGQFTLDVICVVSYSNVC